MLHVKFISTTVFSDLINVSLTRHGFWKPVRMNKMCLNAWVQAVLVVMYKFRYASSCMSFGKAVHAEYNLYILQKRSKLSDVRTE